MESINEYEAERKRRIDQNLMRMKGMGLLETAQEAKMLAIRSNKDKQGRKRAFGSVAEDDGTGALTVVLRRSTRAQGLASEEQLSSLPDDHVDVHAISKRVLKEPPRATCSKGTEEDYEEYNNYR